MGMKIFIEADDDSKEKLELIRDTMAVNGDCYTFHFDDGFAQSGIEFNSEKLNANERFLKLIKERFKVKHIIDLNDWYEMRIG